MLKIAHHSFPFVLSLLAFALPAAGQTEQRRPNIVIILADDK